MLSGALNVSIIPMYIVLFKSCSIFLFVHFPVGLGLYIIIIVRLFNVTFHQTYVYIETNVTCSSIDLNIFQTLSKVRHSQCTV